MSYPGPMNGDRLEFEREHATTVPEDRPDWPLPSFDAGDWARAFCACNFSIDKIDEGLMTAWFANALMRGYDEATSRVLRRPDSPEVVYIGESAVIEVPAGRSAISLEIKRPASSPLMTITVPAVSGNPGGTMPTDEEIERQIRAKGLNAPRLTPDFIAGRISHEHYMVVPGSTMTICALTLKNGFVVTGESAAASPENFDAEIGRSIAKTNAVAKIWALEGYLLRQRLFERDTPPETDRRPGSAPDADDVQAREGWPARE